MRISFLGATAIVVGGLFLNPSARAADTMLLAGVGSLMSRDITAPTITLKGDATTAADIVNVGHGGGHGGGFGHVGAGAAHFAGAHAFHGAWHGGFHGWGWGGYRAWGWGGFRGWGWGGYRGWGWGGFRPWYGYYRPWGGYWGGYPGVAVNFGNGGYAYSAYPSTYYPSVNYYSPSICSCDGYSAAAVAPPGVETAPPPRPNDGYRYDGGPANPIPAPRPVAPQTPPVPRPAAAGAVARRPLKKLEYPAYGETPAKARTLDSLLVKDAPAR